MDETSKYNGFGYDIEDVLHGVGLTYDRFKQHLLNLNRININKTVNPIDVINFGKSYVFFTRPDLNLFVDNKGTINQSIIDNCPDLAMKILSNIGAALALQSSVSQESAAGSGHGLLNLLGNQCAECQVPDIALSLKTAAKNGKGFGISYGGDFIENLSEGDVSVSFIDNRDRDVQTMMEIWLEYIEGVNNGSIMKKRRYISENKLDYAINAYIFTIDESFNIKSNIMLGGMFPTTLNTQLLQYKALPLTAGDFIGPFNYEFHISFLSKPNSHRTIESFNYVTGFGKFINFPISDGSHPYMYTKFNNWYIHNGMIPDGTVFRQGYAYNFSLEDKYPEMVGIATSMLSSGVQNYTLVFASRNLGVGHQLGQFYTRQTETNSNKNAMVRMAGSVANNYNKATIDSSGVGYGQMSNGPIFGAAAYSSYDNADSGDVQSNESGSKYGLTNGRYGTTSDTTGGSNLFGMVASGLGRLFGG